MTDEGTRGLAVVIEDDADVRQLLGLVLGRAGFRVVSAVDGPGGIEAVREHDPVLTTLDVGLPGMDGYAVARAVREISSTHLIMLSGLDAEVGAAPALAAGADDYLVKPFRPRELRACIDAALPS